MKMGSYPYTFFEKLCMDTRATIVYKHYSNYAAIIGYERFVWNLSKLNSRHIDFYCKKLTQVEVGYGLLNVA